MQARISWLRIVILCLALNWPAGTTYAGVELPHEKMMEIQGTYGRLPLYFVENRGQVDKRVKFYAQAGGQTTWFTRKGVVVSLSRNLDQPVQAGMKRRPGPPARSKGPEILTTSVGLRPVGLRKGVKIAAMDPQEHKVNYFIGNDPKKWRTDIPTYKAVAYQEAYQGIDLKFYGDGRQLEYDIVVKPGADPSRVKFQYAGIKGLDVTPAGDLALQLPDGGVLLQKKPVVYQEIAGVRVPREATFKIAGDVAGHTFGFEVAAYDKQAPLIIDPVIIYSNNIGGSASQTGHCIQVDASGCAYVTGVTTSTDFPTKNWYEKSYSVTYNDYSGSYDSYTVTKFNAAGNGLVYSTYLRGIHNFDGTAANDQWGEGAYGQYDHVGLAVDASNCAYITGPTWSKDWPTVYPVYTFQDQNGGAEGFVTKLAAAGNALLYSTYMRGTYNANDYPRDITLGENGTVYVAGSTSSIALNGANIQPYSNWMGFVTKLNPSGTFVWTKGMGSTSPANQDTDVYRIVAEPYNASYPYSGGVWVTGETANTNLYVLNPLQSKFGIGTDPTKWPYKTAFLTWVDSGGTIRFSTYWGGTTAGDWTTGYGIARGGNGDIFVCGSYIWGQYDSTTDTRSFPTSANALKRTMGLDDGGYYTGWNAILFRVTNRWFYSGGVWTFQNPQLLYSTYFGGEYQDSAYAVAADQYGNAYLTGDSFSYHFPLVNPLYTTQGNNIFVSKIGYNASINKMSLLYSTYIGESNGGPDCGGYSIVLDGKHNAYVAGSASSDGFPLIHNVSSPGSGVMVFKLRDTIPLPSLLLLLNK